MKNYDEKIVSFSGTTFYYLRTSKGWRLSHRLDGPAIIWPEGTKAWMYMGKKINVSSQEEFEHWLKLKAFW